MPRALPTPRVISREKMFLIRQGPTTIEEVGAEKGIPEPEIAEPTEGGGIGRRCGTEPCELCDRTEARALELQKEGMPEIDAWTKAQEEVDQQRDIEAGKVVPEPDAEEPAEPRAA